METGKNLDALGVKPGSVVVCTWKDEPSFTYGRKYTISENGGVIDDDGDNWVTKYGRNPSTVTFMVTPPLPFGEMSDAEQGALLLAAHRGEVIELHAGCFGWIEWDGEGSLFEAHQPVRVRPAITRHPLTVNGQHVGTVAMQDGKVIPESVEWSA